MTEITLAICMYNAENYIEETLACILAQTMQDFHLLIVNDCSTDKSVECVERFFTKNPRQYEMVSLHENRGLCAGRRYVEEYANTKYLLFVEAKKEKLIFMQPTAIYDREVALSVGGHRTEGFPMGKPRYQDLCEDLDLWTRMSDLYMNGKAIVVVPEVLCRYRKHENALSANSIGMLLRMRHIKTNLKRRRRGQEEYSFIDFRAQMPTEEMLRLEKEACAADALRRAYYHLRAGHIIVGVKDLFLSIKSNPHYIVDKVKHNLLRMK